MVLIEGNHTSNPPVRLYGLHKETFTFTFPKISSKLLFISQNLKLYTLPELHVQLWNEYLVNVTLMFWYTALVYTADSQHVILTFAALMWQCQLGRRAEQLVAQPVTTVNMTVA
jgi:hypothetical protein